MNAFVLHDTSDAREALRWGTSAAAITAAHAALIALGLAWYTQRPPPGVSIPTIMVDMAPATASPQPTPMDIAPGPVMQEADASPPVETARPGVVSVGVDDDSAMKKVVAGLDEAGIAVTELSLHLPSLDEVFFSLTGRHDSDGAEDEEGAA